MIYLSMHYFICIIYILSTNNIFFYPLFSMYFVFFLYKLQVNLVSVIFSTADYSLEVQQQYIASIYIYNKYKQYIASSRNMLHDKHRLYLSCNNLFH